MVNQKKRIYFYSLELKTVVNTLRGGVFVCVMCACLLLGFTVSAQNEAPAADTSRQTEAAAPAATTAPPPAAAPSTAPPNNYNTVGSAAPAAVFSSSSYYEDDFFQPERSMHTRLSHRPVWDSLLVGPRPFHFGWTDSERLALENRYAVGPQPFVWDSAAALIIADSLQWDAAAADSLLNMAMRDTCPLADTVISAYRPPITPRASAPYQERTWLFYIFCTCVALFLMVWQGFPEYSRSLYKSLINYHSARIYFEERIVPFSLPDVLLSINLCVIYSLFIFEVYKFFIPLPYKNYLSVLAILIFFIALVLLARLFFLKGIATLLPVGDKISFYYYQTVITDIAMSVFLLPVLVVAVYWNPTWWLVTGLGVGVFFIAIRYLRGLRIASDIISSNKLYFFLYLCALEIVPFLLMIKILAILSKKII